MQLNHLFLSTYLKGLHILCQGAGHLKRSQEAKGAQEGESVHGRGKTLNCPPQTHTGVIYIVDHTDT